MGEKELSLPTLKIIVERMKRCIGLYEAISGWPISVALKALTKSSNIFQTGRVL